MRYEYTITKEGAEAEIMKAMSWKKFFKSLLLKYPKFNGSCTYINKKETSKYASLEKVNDSTAVGAYQTRDENLDDYSHWSGHYFSNGQERWTRLF